MKQSTYIYFASRAIIFGIAYFYIVLMKDQIFSLFGFLNLFNHWDSVHYINIASVGYTFGGEGAAGNTLAFYPLYSLLIRLFSLGFTSLLMPTALILSLISGILAALLIYKYTAKRFNQDTAIASVWLLFFFPSSVFLSAYYTESLFLALALAAFYLFYKQKYLPVIILCSLLAVLRPNGFTVAVALFCAHLVLIKSKKAKLAPLFWWPLSMAPFLAFSYYQYTHFGSVIASNIAQATGWTNHTLWPWQGIYIMIRNAFFIETYPAWSYVFKVELLFFAAAVVFFVKKIRLFTPPEAIFVGLNLLLFACESVDLSKPRFLLILFPLFVVGGKLIAEKPERRAWVIILFAVWMALNALAFFDYKPIV